MLIKRTPDVSSSEITDEHLYLRRRDFIRMAGGALAGAAAATSLGAFGAVVDAAEASAPPAADLQAPLQNITKKMVTTTEPLNKFEEITGYNNYYEFGTGKGDPASTPASSRPLRGR